MENEDYKFSYIFSGILISILLILFSQIGSLNFLYSAASYLAGGLNQKSYDSFANLRENIDFWKNLRNIKGERDNLYQENLELISQNSDLQNQINTNASVQRQLQFDLPYKLTAVRIIKVDEFSTGKITINKGRSAGLKEGNVVIYDNYAVGEITEVADGAAVVRLINSVESKVPVISIKSKTKGILKGDIEKGLLFDDILINSKLKTNDILVTSGINSNYPYGLNVGRVGEINLLASELTKSSEVINMLDFKNLFELFVITD